MTPEELAKLWQNELSKANKQYKPWEDFTDEEKQLGISVAKEVLTHVGLPWPRITKESITEIRNLLNWLEADYT